MCWLKTLNIQIETTELEFTTGRSSDMTSASLVVVLAMAKMTDGPKSHLACPLTR